MTQRICIVGGGIGGLGAAWTLLRHPDRFDVHVFEKNDRLGGNAVTVDIPQAEGPPVPIDISVTAFIPSVYQNYMELMKLCGIEHVPTRFSYTVHYDGGVYAHDFASPLKDELRGEIARFQDLLTFLKRFNVLNARPSIALSFVNPWNYVSMGQVLDFWGLSSAFRYKILKPLFVNFVLATNVFDMPASMFSRYLDFFDIERATPMTTWKGGTREIYRRMTASFRDRIHLGRDVTKITRDGAGVTVRDATGREERFDQVILACNANQALMMLDRPTAFERRVLGSVRYESELHNHAVVHTDASVLPKDETHALETRSNFILHYGSRPDNYEITYIMHNQQPWAKASDRPCLVTYNPIQPIDPAKVVTRTWFQHVVHDVYHTTVLLNLFPMLQGKRRTWYCGAHTVVNSQEHSFISGMAVARQLGAEYPFKENRDAAEWFNFYGRLMHGPLFRKG
jgi:predicted NAD/FAD-binding protein